jgi:hypothetical protein
MDTAELAVGTTVRVTRTQGGGDRGRWGRIAEVDRQLNVALVQFANRAERCGAGRMMLWNSGTQWNRR